jgi:hypothetical protein
MAAVAAYAVAVWISQAAGLAPVRLLFDGPHPIQPYSFVNPPEDLAAQNVEPQPGEVVLGLLSPGVVESGSVTTNDGQASLSFPAQTFPARPGQEVRVAITPEDPARFGPPPEGLRIDGNAYTFTASYEPSGEEAVPGQEVTALLRYPVRANVLLRWDGNGWTRLKTTTVPATLQVYANIDQLGTLAAAGTPESNQQNLLLLIPFAAIALAALAGLRARLRQRSKWNREGTRVGRKGRP